MSHDLLILGASARAAAFSALRCGYRPRCADYFADQDLAAVCPVERIDYRHRHRDFIAFAESLPPTPWFYTGGFENDPECVDRISRRHALLGMPGQTLRSVRDPGLVAAVLNGHGIPCPQVRSNSTRLPRDSSWLQKPLASGGGREIGPLTDQTDAGSAASSVYFQERIDGPSFSALYVGEAAAARFVGVTRQLIGIEGCPFGYRGSIGPVAMSGRVGSQLEAIGNVLTTAFGLVGWFGVDFILRDGIPWPVEVNPRYTATVEIYELAWGRAILPMHQQACANRTPPRARPDHIPKPLNRVVGKWILHAAHRLVAPEFDLDDDEGADLFRVPPLADIPQPGTTFRPGDPVMTLMAAGSDIEECASRLAQLEQIWTTRLGMTGGQADVRAILSSCEWPGGDHVL